MTDTNLNHVNNVFTSECTKLVIVFAKPFFQQINKYTEINQFSIVKLCYQTKSGNKSH